MIKRVTRPQIKKLLREKGSIVIYVGNYCNGVFYGGCYKSTITTMEQAEQSLYYAFNNGWSGNLCFGIE